MKLTYLLLALVFLISCDSETTEQVPDVSHLKFDIHVERFDQLVGSLTGDDPGRDYVTMLGKYPRMTDLYFKQLLKIHDADDAVFFPRLSAYLKEERITRLADTIEHIYPSLQEIEKDLNKSLQYYKHYFPDAVAPNFYAVMTEFGYPTFIFKDVDRDAIGIGLDMFLGADFNYKLINGHDPAFSQYMTRTYNKEHVAKKAVEMMVVDRMGDPPGLRFIDQMIHHGKRLYILDKVLPFLSDTIIFEYTPSQLSWCENNQKPMWNYFLENNLMYETNHLKTTKLFQPAPTTSGMPPESPGRAATYMGYKIISAYMARNPDLSLSELVAIKDSQAILEESKFKPKRT